MKEFGVTKLEIPDEGDIAIPVNRSDSIGSRIALSLYVNTFNPIRTLISES